VKVKLGHCALSSSHSSVAKDSHLWRCDVVTGQAVPNTAVTVRVKPSKNLLGWLDPNNEGIEVLKNNGNYPIIQYRIPQDF
jgi:hypothetical protein